GPDSGLEVDISPAHGQRLASPAATQQKEAEYIRGIPVIVLGKRLRQPLDLIAAQITFARDFIVALDPPTRIIGPPFPLHGKRAGFAQHGDGSVSPIRPAILRKSSVKRVDVRK